MKVTKHIRPVSLVVVIIILVQYLLQTTGCAIIVAPTGGPKDSLPPVLMSALPKDSTKNFTENDKKIIFEFNEFVELKDIQKNLIVSPYPKTPPTVESKLRTVTVRLKDTLQVNTTYTLDFGNALQDINEGNILKNFTYIFSTGNEFDSRTLSGKVIVAETGNVDSTLTVFLYKNKTDSAVTKENPRYITRLDSTGRFTFKNLPADTFALYAWKDEGARRYFGSKQLFAFADSAVSTANDNAPITLYAFLESEEQRKPTTTTKSDSKEKSDDKRLKYITSLSNNKQDILDSLRITFESPLKNYDTTKLIFTAANFSPVTDYTLKIDSTNKEFTLKHNWIEDTAYHIIMEKDFAEDSTGKFITKSDTISFRTMKKDEYGSLRLRFSNFDASKNPLLVLLQNDKVKFSTPIESTQYRAKLFLPGEYIIRIVYDENKNGKWDTGSFFGTKRQPEKAQTFTKKLTVKANWDNEADVDL